MALRELVEGECGGANSLVRLGSHFVQDRALKEEGFRYPFQPGDGFTTSDSDQLVQQFLEETLGQATPSFRMDSLLVEMRELERGGEVLKTGPVQSPPVAQLAAELDDSCWADQYIEAGKNFNDVEHVTNIWAPDGNKPNTSNGLGEVYELGFGPKWAKEYLESNEHLQLDDPDTTFYNEASVEDYKAELNKDSSELKDIANEIVETADDQKFTYSKFMKFMRQIGDGEVAIEDGEVIHSSEQDVADTWASEFSENQLLGAHSASNTEPDLNEKAFTDQLWSKLAHQWEQMTKEDDQLTHPWNLEFNDFSAAFKDYNFENDNPMTELPDALEEGLKRLEAGDLPSAVLCFEAAAQSDADNPLVWQYLGTTQAQNEQDPKAIAALKRCLQLNPSNLTALMALSVCYTNENYQQQACSALKEWLHMNPKYSDLVRQEEAHDKIGGISTLMTRDLHKEVCDLYIAAARRNPLELIDPDVQCGLGVLFNLTNEQDKAADCFKAALQARPDDARLWNRLGATYANGDRSEEAVDAYHHALELSPGFVRARYNLGITCTHLGAHREAVEHLLIALNQQAAGRGLQGEKSLSMSDTIWSTLRLVISLLDRRDLLTHVNNRNLTTLNKEFGITSNS